MADRLIRTESDFAAITLNEIAEVPGDGPVRQFKATGKSLAAWSVPEGVRIRINDEQMLLDPDHVISLRDWLKGATYDPE